MPGSLKNCMGQPSLDLCAALQLGSDGKHCLRTHIYTDTHHLDFQDLEYGCSETEYVAISAATSLPLSSLQAHITRMQTLQRRSLKVSINSDSGGEEAQISTRARALSMHLSSQTSQLS